MRSNRFGDQSGFTLIEVMVAAFILVLGALAAFGLIDGANATTSVNAARVTATNLERELTEFSRGAEYNDLQPASLVSTLRQNASIAGSGSDPWTIQRRGVTYTVDASVCVFDDPKDGTGAAGSLPANACATGDPAPGVAKTDTNPDDFRRVTFTLDWHVRSRMGTMTQSVLVVNPSGGLGPRIATFGEPIGDITGNAIAWGGPLLSLTTAASPAASGIHWSADDGVSAGDATGSGQDWAFTWNLGTPKLDPLTIDGTWVVDGTYIVQAQAFDSRGVPGETRLVTVHINRHPPAKVTGVQAGYNPRNGSPVVDLTWAPEGERDIRGYQVFRSDGTEICPGNGASYTEERACTDTHPGGPGGSVSYTVYAVDCRTLSAATCDPERGTASDPKVVNLSAGQPPAEPTGVTATIVDGLPKLDWTAVAGAKLYRIYRDDGTGLADRYDATSTSAATYTDPNPGTSTRHTYWVTAVDSNFNESVPSAPVTSPGP